MGLFKVNLFVRNNFNRLISANYAEEAELKFAYCQSKTFEF